jgi:predicted PurR-regulated permease PerM
MTKQVAIYGMAVMTTLLALLILWQFRTVAVYVLISLTLAAAIRPLVQRLAGQKFAIRMIWILLYILVLGSFVFLLFLTGKAIVSEIQSISQNASVRDAWLIPGWLQGTTFQKTIFARIPSPSKLFDAVTGEQGQLVLPAMLGFFQGVGGVLSAVFVILFLSLYWSINQVHFERLWLSLLPSSQRSQARGVWRTVEPDIGAYIRSEIIQSLLAGLLFGLGSWLLGSPYPALLALAGALACLIPVVGEALALIIVILVGLMTSVQISLFTGLFALVALIAMRIWVKPRLFNRGWDNPILTVILLITMADAFGLAGVIVAPPLSVVCQILWSRLVIHRLASGDAVQLSDIKERQERLKELIVAMDEQPPPLVTSSMERLNHLIGKAEPILQAVPLVGSADPSIQISTNPELKE